MIIDSDVVTDAWSPAIMFCRERELCGFVHGEDFIITGDSMQLAWIESRPSEGLVLRRRAIPGPDDGDDKTVTILNRLVTWVCLDLVTRSKLKPIRAIERSCLRRQREVSDNSSGEGAIVVTADAHKA